MTYQAPYHHIYLSSVEVGVYALKRDEPVTKPFLLFHSLSDKTLSEGYFIREGFSLEDT